MRVNLKYPIYTTIQMTWVNQTGIKNQKSQMEMHPGSRWTEIRLSATSVSSVIQTTRKSSASDLDTFSHTQEVLWCCSIDLHALSLLNKNNKKTI